jgi:hypothetical protein
MSDRLDRYSRSLTSPQIEGLLRCCGVPKAEIESLRSTPSAFDGNDKFDWGEDDTGKKVYPPKSRHRRP